MRLNKWLLCVFIMVLLSFPFLGLIIAQNNLEGELFSVIGGNRGCSEFPDRISSEIIYEEEFDISKFIQESCGKGFGLVDTYDINWVPYKEYKDGIFRCPYENGCNAEVYCCPYGDCVDDSECRKNVGLFSKCKNVECLEWKNDGYKCEVNHLIEKNISYQYNELSYCTNSLKSNNVNIILIIVVLLLLVLFYKWRPFKK